MLTQAFIRDRGIDALKSELAITVRSDGPLLTLNYHQLKSPKTHPIVRECRALTLEAGTYRVVSRAFDRFLNDGENNETIASFPLERCLLFEKSDGSLVKLYHYDGRWRLATRGVADASGPHPAGKTYEWWIRLAGGVSSLDDIKGDPALTYCFEYVGPENRIITPYQKPSLVLLAIRNNATGEEYPIRQDAVGGISYRLPRVYFCKSPEAIGESLKKLDPLDEGFVLYDPVTCRRLKIKSQSYVQLHAARTTLTTKGITLMILSGSDSDYLSRFPEDRERFDAVRERVLREMTDLDALYGTVPMNLSAKEFAAVVHSPRVVKYRPLWFEARKQGVQPSSLFSTDGGLRLLLSVIE
jgi:hypothetical protein